MATIRRPWDPGYTSADGGTVDGFNTQQTYQPGGSYQSYTTGGGTAAAPPSTRVTPAPYPNTGVVPPSTTKPATGGTTPISIPPSAYPNTGVVPPAGSVNNPYQPPQQPVPVAGGTSTLRNVLGVDTGKFSDPTYSSPKYDLAHLASQYLDPTVGITSDFVARAAAAGFKNAHAIGKDKIGYTGQNGQPVEVDLIQGFNSGHPQLQYLLSGGGGGAGSAAPLPPIGMGGVGVGGGLGAGQTAQPGAGAGSSDIESFINDLLKKGGIQNANWNAAGKAAQGLIDNGGAFDDRLVNARLESQREMLNRAQKGILSDMDAQLADRGLASMPGHAQGAALTGVERTANDIAGQFSTAARDIISNEQANADQRYVGAISQLTGLGNAQASSLVDLISQAGELSKADADRLVQYLALKNNMSIEQAKIAVQYAQIAAQERSNQMNYSLGLGQLGLGRENSANAQQQAYWQYLVQLAALQGQNAGTAAGGYF